MSHYKLFKAEMISIELDLFIFVLLKISYMNDRSTT